MCRLAEGDRSAFEPVFNRLWPLLQRYAARVLGDPTRAEDAAQRALLKIFERASTYDRARSALGWAMAFVFWECRTEKTKVRRAKASLLTDEFVSAGESAEESIARLQWEKAAMELIEQLPVRERALVWAEVQPELAAALAGTDPATLRKRKERLLKRLRGAFNLIVKGEAEDHEP